MRQASHSVTHALIALSLLVSGGASAGEPTLFAVTPPRQFGYVIGDEMALEATASLPSGYAPDPDSLPKPGRANAFVELRSVQMQTASGDRLRLRVNYLVVNSAPEVRTVETPPVAIRLRKTGAEDLTISMPTIPFTVSPLTPAEVLARDGLEELQPDAPTPRIDTAWMRVRLLVLAVLAVLLTGWLAWVKGWVPDRWLARRPFARVAAAIARIEAGGAPDLKAAQARQLHRAFDESAGFAITRDTLERFFAEHPGFATLRTDVEAFFSASAAFFYAERTDAMPDAEALRRLARALAACERDAGRAG